MALALLTGEMLAERVGAAVPGSVVALTPTLSQRERGTMASDASGDALYVAPDSVARVAEFLQRDEDLDFQYLNSISAVDYIGHFELVYHLTSFRREHQAVVKSRLQGREELSAPSVYHLWRGADFQEREVWDLMGIRFEGHPNMKRIMLWEGFQGHPLRKDFL